jgi:deazaflavin-dependent oxidoreductase (nitroreductase family)
MSDWNSQAIAEFRGANGKTGRWGSNLVIMHTIGAKTGEERIAPVMGLPLDQTRSAWTIIASKGGAPENPAWYHNLVAHPEFDVEAFIGDEIQTVPVRARELHDAEYDAAWERMIAVAPGFESYKEKTARLMPIFQLTRS